MGSSGESSGETVGNHKKHYKEDMPIAKIGECLGLSENKVRNLESKAFRELRRGHREELAPFLPEHLQAKAYSGNGVALFNRTWTSSTERAALELCKGGRQDTELVVALANLIYQVYKGKKK